MNKDLSPVASDSSRKRIDLGKYLKDELGNVYRLRVAKYLLTIVVYATLFSIGRDMLQFERVTIFEYKLSSDNGFYQSDTVRLIYPTDFIQLEEVQKSGVAVMTSLTELDSDQGSFPRIDSLLVSSTMFLGETASELSEDFRQGIFQELAYTIIASYYGDDVVGLDTVIDFAGLPAELGAYSCDMETDKATAYLELLVDPYKGLPEMLFRVQLDAVLGRAAITVLATHDTILPEIENLFVRIFKSVELQTGSDIVEHMDIG